MTKFDFAAYPKVLLVDANYKLNEVWMPVYFLLAINGKGQSEIVSVFITALETEIAITKMVQANNPRCSHTNVVMSNKDFVERTVFCKKFPQASLLIYHNLTQQEVRKVYNVLVDEDENFSGWYLTQG